MSHLSFGSNSFEFILILNAVNVLDAKIHKKEMSNGFFTNN